MSLAATAEDGAVQTHRELLSLTRELSQLEEQKCYKFSNFVKLAWHILEPTVPLVWNWHMEVMCDVLQEHAERIAARKPRKKHVIFNVPPRSSKSGIVVKMFPAWVWTRWPDQKFMTASYSGDLATEHALSSRRIIQDPWYLEKWGHMYTITTDQNVKTHYENDKRGYRIATSVGGSATGQGGDYVIADDPLSADQSYSEAHRKATNRWWTQTMHSRLNDQQIGVRIIIMQRLHEEDLVGYIRSRPLMQQNYELYCFPGELSDDVAPKKFRKKYVNGLLWPERFGIDVLNEYKEALGEYGYAGQIMQSPSPAEGGVFKRQNWVFWKPKGMNLPDYSIKVNDKIHTMPTLDLPDAFDDVVDSWDCTFKKLEDNDYVVGQKWGKAGVMKYLLTQIRDRMTFSETVNGVKRLQDITPRPSGVLIESAANGPAVIDSINQEIAGVIPVVPRGSKEARAMPMSRQQEAHNLALPHPAIAPWVEDFIGEYAHFPNGTRDDQIDAGDQAIDRLSGARRVVSNYKGAHLRFKVDFRRLERTTRIYVSQWVSEAISSSIVYAVWNPTTAKLWVWDQTEMNTAIPEMIKIVVLKKLKEESGGYIKTLRPIRWLGNNLMFSRLKSTAMANRRQGMSEAYSRCKINLEDNDQFDEYGALMLLTRLFAMDAIHIHSRCTELVRQLLSWSITNEKPDNGFYLCRALSNLVSMLWERGMMKEVQRKIKPYSTEKQKIFQKMDQADNLGQLGKYVIGQNTQAPENIGKDGWMT